MDSENNVYVLQQKGQYTCDLTSNTCSWEWDTGTGATLIQAFSGIVQKTGTGTTVNVSTGSGRTINEWMHEFASSDIYSFGATISMWLFYFFLLWLALGFGFVYGFKFFKNKKNG